MSEFEMIAEYFVPLTMGRAETADLKDDAAVLSIPKGCELVVTSDTLNEGVHFMKGEAAHNIAHKALRVNLSDLAAMGAKPLCYQLCTSFPKKPDEEWLEAFTGALLKDQKEYGLFCSGGDTTSQEGLISISITAMGLVPKGKAMRRDGACVGDSIVLTGPLGDAVLGWMSLKARAKGDEDMPLYGEAIQHYHMPHPRLEAVDIIRKYVHAASDISDGAIADIGHICVASHVGAQIETLGLKASKEVQHALEENILSIEKILTSGDDYELLLAVPPENIEPLINELKRIGLNPCVIGTFQEKKAGFQVFDPSGQEIGVQEKGWQHF